MIRQKQLPFLKMKVGYSILFSILDLSSSIYIDHENTIGIQRSFISEQQRSKQRIGYDN